MSKLPDAVIERMIDEYRQGATYREIAVRHGLLYDKVRRTLVARTPARRTGPPEAPVSDDLLVHLRGQELTWQQIGREVGMSASGAKHRYYRIMRRRKDQS